MTDFAKEEFLADLADAAGESRSVLAEYPAVAADLRKSLVRWLKATPDVSAEDSGDMSPEIRRILEKAGYLEPLRKED